MRKLFVFLLALVKQKDIFRSTPMPTHNLIRPHVDAASGLPESLGGASPEEIDRRVDELVLEWTKFYFSGNPFMSPSPGGADVEKTFALCDVFSGKFSLPDLAARPIIHTMILDRRDGDGVEIGGKKVFQSDFAFNTFVKVAPGAPVDPDDAAVLKSSAGKSAEHAARRVSSQFSWLLQSPHAADLVIKGIGHPRVVSGPRSVQSGAWEVFQISWNARVHFTIASL